MHATFRLYCSNCTLLLLQYMHFHSSMTRTSGYDTEGGPPVHISFHSSRFQTDPVGRPLVMMRLASFRSHHLSLEFHYSTSHFNSIVIFPFVQAACSTSSRTTRHAASLPIQCRRLRDHAPLHLLQGEPRRPAFINRDILKLVRSTQRLVDRGISPPPTFYMKYFYLVDHACTLMF